MGKFEGTNLLDFKRELLRDDRERLEYNRLKPKYDMIQMILKPKSTRIIKGRVIQRVKGKFETE